MSVHLLLPGDDGASVVDVTVVTSIVVVVVDDGTSVVYG